MSGKHLTSHSKVQADWQKKERRLIDKVKGWVKFSDYNIRHLLIFEIQQNYWKAALPRQVNT
jgi:hypothetical protein